MFKLQDFRQETAAKRQVDQLTEERSQIKGYAGMAGNLLGTLGNDLSGGPKFAYELLQNAHDTGSSKNPVSLYVYHEGDYLIWAHTGDRLFTLDDVDGISNAARSNDEEIDHKSRNLGMIGYKGIGFKAVLARADRIHIISGDYSFGFDQIESEKRLAPYIAKNKSIRYLWQVLPYWMPVAGDSEALLKRCYEHFVAFKPHFPGHACPEPTTFFMMHIPGFNFEVEFSYLQEDLSWMMFLENFSKMVFLNEQVCLARKIISSADQKLEVQLIKESKTNILTNDSYLIRSEEVVKTREIDVALSRLTDYQCPQRLKEARSTLIKIAVALNAERGLKPVSAGQLFVGLPLAGHKDANQLVHVQANFLLDTRRYSLTDDGPWNNFLLRAAGQALLKFLAELALSDEPYWNQTLKVLPKSWRLRGAFYDGINQALAMIPFLPSDQNKKLLLRRSEAYLDTTTSRYGTGFYYEFPKLPVKPMRDYYLNLPHRELVNVDQDLLEDVLGLLILLNTLDPEYFRSQEMQVRLLTFLGERPELLANRDVLSKVWILNQNSSFSSLKDSYIRFKIEDDDGWYALCQRCLNLPRMVVANKLPPSLIKTLLAVGCNRLDADAYDNLMRTRLTSESESFVDDFVIHRHFNNRENQIALLKFIAKQINSGHLIQFHQQRILKAKKIILRNVGDGSEAFGSLEESYLPGVIQENQAWYEFCRDFFKLPVIKVANELPESVAAVLVSRLGCKVLISAEYDQRMCAYLFEHADDIAHLKSIFHNEEAQFSLITLLYTQSHTGKLSTRNLAVLKKMRLFLSKAGGYHSCDRLFMPVAAEEDLNELYTHLLQLSELAVAHRLSPAIKAWVSREFNINQVSQADFQSKFFNLIASADEEQEEHLQSQFESAEAQQNLLKFIASPTGDRHRASIKEKCIIRVKTGEAVCFVKSLEVYTLSDALSAEDAVLVSVAYPALPVLDVTISEEDKRLYEKQLGFKNLTPESLARKLSVDVAKDYLNFKSSTPGVFSTEANTKLILHFIIRHFTLIEKTELFDDFRCLCLSTLDPQKMRSAFFLYLPVQYHPKDPIEIAGGADFRESFVSAEYIDWASANGIDLSLLKKAFVALGASEQLTATVVPSISVSNFHRLEPQIARRFIADLKLPETIRFFKFLLHYPLLLPLISGCLSLKGKVIEANMALENLVETLQVNWKNCEKNRKNEGVGYGRPPTEYTLGFSLIRHVITQLIQDIQDRYYTENSLKWAAPWLPKLPLPEHFNITQEQASYLGLRCFLDKMACELLLTRMPETENKTAAQYYRHYELIFKFLLSQQPRSGQLVRPSLPADCLLLAEDDSWQPRKNLSYVVLESQRKRSSAYLRRWPLNMLTQEEQKKLALILSVKVLESKDITCNPISPIVELPGLVTLLTVTGLPYLALAKAQDEAKSQQEISAQLAGQLAGWRFMQAEKIQIRPIDSDEVLQEISAYQNEQERIFYLKTIKTKTQAETVKNALVRLLSEVLNLQPSIQPVLNFLLNNMGSAPEFTLNLEGLEQDMQDQGYNVASLRHQPDDIDQTLVPDFSVLAIADADSDQAASAEAELPLAILNLSLNPQQARGSASGHSRRSSQAHRSSGKSAGIVRAPSLSTAVSFWQPGSQEPRREVYSGDVEPVTEPHWASVELDEMKPNQLDLLSRVATVKTAAMAPTPGQLLIRLDPVEPLVMPALPAAAASQSLEDFLKATIPCIQFSGLNDGIGYWGEALVYCWLLSQKYGSKFTESVVHTIAPGHSVLTGPVKENKDSGELRLSRSYHVIWHREAGQRQAAHDFTVVKTYDQTGEQKLTVHEVKTTKYTQEQASGLTRGNVSRNQLSELAFYGNRYRLYRVYGAGKPGAELECLCDPAALISEGKLLVKSLGL